MRHLSKGPVLTVVAGERTEPLALLSSTATALIQSETEEALRAVLEHAAHLFAEISSARIGLCEIGLSPSGKPLILWQAAQGGLTVEEDAGFFRWFENAVRGTRAFSNPRADASWQGLLSSPAISRDTGIHVALKLDGETPSADVLSLAPALVDMAAASLSRMRGASAQSLEHRYTGEMLEAARRWLELGADIGWEARNDGRLRCRRILNRREEIARAVEGLRLSQIFVGAGGHSLLDHLEASGSVRHMRVQPEGSLRTALQPGEALYVSAARRKGDAREMDWVGTFSVVAGDEARSGVREAVAMMAQVKTGRLREERQRREAEAMLQGLRLLLANNTSSEKLGELVSLIVDCIGGEQACVLQRALDGSPRYLVPARKQARSDVDEILAFIADRVKDERAEIFDTSEDEGARFCRALEMSGHQLAVLPLPLHGEHAFLFCTTRRKEGFSSVDLGFADRFTLLLQQALFLRDEQAQIAQTAKMAALGQMSTSIAHELRQPLNTISLAVQNLEFMMSEPNFDSDAAAVKVARILAQVERASDVIDRMRRFGRKSAGESNFVEVGDLVEGVEAIMNHVLLQAGVRFEKQMPENLTVFADQLQLEQVIANLMQNAVDAISGIGARHEREESLIRIVAAPAAEEGMAVIRVEDSGPGFRPEIMERVLQPFFTTKSAEHGTGLGLAICDTIVRESGGRIELGNHAGGGYVALLLPMGK